MTTKAKDNVKVSAAVMAVVISVGSLVYNTVYGYGALSQRVTNVEQRQDRAELQQKDDNAKMSDDLKYIRSRVDMLIDRQ